MKFEFLRSQSNSLIQLNDEIPYFKGKRCKACKIQRSIKHFRSFSRCGHQFCNTCLDINVEQSIKKSKLIGCLQPRCSCCVNMKDPMFDNLSRENKSLYHRYLREQYRKQGAGSQPCLLDDCDGQIHISNKICNKCKNKFCDQCFNNPYQNQQCIQMKKQLRQIQLNYYTNIICLQCSLPQHNDYNQSTCTLFLCKCRLNKYCSYCKKMTRVGNHQYRCQKCYQCGEKCLRHHKCNQSLAIRRTINICFAILVILKIMIIGLLKAYLLYINIVWVTITILTRSLKKSYTKCKQFHVTWFMLFNILLFVVTFIAYIGVELKYLLCCDRHKVDYILTCPCRQIEDEQFKSYLR